MSRKSKGVYFFKLPSRKDEFYQKWKKELVSLLSKYRIIDNILKERIKVGNVYFCEKHFSPEDMEFTSNN